MIIKSTLQLVLVLILFNSCHANQYSIDYGSQQPIYGSPQARAMNYAPHTELEQYNGGEFGQSMHQHVIQQSPPSPPSSLPPQHYQLPPLPPPPPPPPTRPLPPVMPRSSVLPVFASSSKASAIVQSASDETPDELSTLDMDFRTSAKKKRRKERKRRRKYKKEKYYDDEDDYYEGPKIVYVEKPEEPKKDKHIHTHNHYHTHHHVYHYPPPPPPPPPAYGKRYGRSIENRILKKY